MKGYIYKVVIFAIAIIIVFEFTIGKQINNFNQKINYLTTKEGNIIKQVRRHNFDKVKLLDQPAHGACTLISRELTFFDMEFKESDVSANDKF